jgi:hypothetical protein
LQNAFSKSKKIRRGSSECSTSMLATHLVGSSPYHRFYQPAKPHIHKLRAQASQCTAARDRGIRHRCPALKGDPAKRESIEAVTTFVLCRRPKSSNAKALHRLQRIRQNPWNPLRDEASRQVPETKIQGTVFVFSTPSTLRVSLTGRSTGTSMLRIAAR